MSLNIKNRQTVALARRLAEITGESLTEAVTVALAERLEREEGRGAPDRARIASLQARSRQLPLRDSRPLQDLCDELWEELAT